MRQKKMMIFSVIALVFSYSGGSAFAQEPGLATYHETAQVLVDKSMSQNVTASITLQSTSIQEIRIPYDLEGDIREDGKVIAMVVTNQDRCVLGVFDMSCVMINVERDPADKGILEIQDSSKEIGNQYIDRINKVFGTEATLHSVFVHSDDQSNQALGTSGIISGRGAISVVYTMPMEDTGSMYEKISALLLPKEIRESGGFYSVARELSNQENAKVTFSLIPADSHSLMQLKLSVDYPGEATDLSQISPFEFLKIEELARSDYFSGGFYPLNSLVQVVVLSPGNSAVSDVAGDQVPTQTVDNEKIPTDITKQGWIFDPKEGQIIQGMYIFGEETLISRDDLIFALDGSAVENPPPEPSEFDDSVAIVAAITAVAIASAVFYLKGYKRQSQ